MRLILDVSWQKGVWEFGSVWGVFATGVDWYSELAFAWVFDPDVIKGSLEKTRRPFAILGVESKRGMQPCSRKSQLTKGSSRRVTAVLVSEVECGLIN